MLGSDAASLYGFSFFFFFFPSSCCNLHPALWTAISFIGLLRYVIAGSIRHDFFCLNCLVFSPLYWFDMFIGKDWVFSLALCYFEESAHFGVDLLGLDKVIGQL